MKKLIRKILLEDRQEALLKYAIKNVEKPYYYNLKNAFGLKENEIYRVLTMISGGIPPEIDRGVVILLDEYGQDWYNEITETGEWEVNEYGGNAEITYYEDSSGKWYRVEYDYMDNPVYKENQDGVVFDRREDDD
jgi:hypothetical protein